MVNDGLRSDTGDGRDHIIRGETLFLCFMNDLEGERVAKDLAAGSLGRIETEVRVVVQEIIDDVLVDSTASTHLTIFVVLASAVGIVAHRGIDEDITWTGVEIVACIHATMAIWWDETDVGNTSNVLTGAQLSGMMQDQRVEEGDQRRALSTRRLVTNPEVCHRGDASARSQE